MGQGIWLFDVIWCYLVGGFKGFFYFQPLSHWGLIPIGAPPWWGWICQMWMQPASMQQLGPFGTFFRHAAMDAKCGWSTFIHQFPFCSIMFHHVPSFYIIIHHFPHVQMAMDQYLYIPFLGGWTSIYPSPNESSHRPPKRLVVGRFLIDHKAMHAAGWWHVRHPSWVWRVHWTEMIYTHIYIYLYETNDLHIV